MKPIIFSTPMVQAILDGRKTMTRRVVKPQPTYITPSGRWVWPIPKSKVHPCCCTEVCTASREWWEYLALDQTPYQPGDVLWVRETWGDHGGKTSYFLYRADFPDGAKTYEWPEKDETGEPIICDLPRWRPSIFMPREAARIFLRVTDVRVERLQEISEEDAAKEGLAPAILDGAVFISAKGKFHVLWETINAKRGYGWDTNPWVWVVSFERTEIE